MNNTEKQIAGGIILTVVVAFLLFASGLGIFVGAIVVLAALAGFMLMSSGLSYMSEDGIFEEIPDGEYTFGSFYEETISSHGEDIPRENRSKVVQVWPEEEENFFGRAISWRVYRNNDPERHLENTALVPGLVLRIRNNIIEKVVLHTPD